MSTIAFAQTGVQSGTAYGVGNDSIECVRNISFFKTYAKSNNYKDAYEFWKKVYDNCPGASKDTYIIGEKLLFWRIEEAKTEEDRTKAVDALMDLYDNRIKYFGDDEKTGKDYVMANKVQSYTDIYKEKADYNKVYSWLEPIVKEKGADTDPLALYFFTYSSMIKQMLDPAHKEQYVKDQLMVDGYYASQIAAAKSAGNEKRAENYAGYKSSAEAAFAASGAASCDVMERIYSVQVEEKKGDLEFLKSVIGLFQGVRCTESNTYFAASDYLYQLEPSSGAALGIARKAMADKNYDRAKKFYTEAIDLSTSGEEKGEAYYSLATMAYKQGSYATARNYCNQAMEVRSGFGAPMLLIAQMYAASATSIYDDPIKQRIVYCLVVDKCARAKAIDPSISAEANRLISTYSQHFPAKEDVFMHPDLNAGASFTVGGWIGETTTIRTR